MVENTGRPLDLDAVADGYLRYSAALRPEDDPDAALDLADPDTLAYLHIERLVRHGPPEAAWDLVVRVLRRAPDDGELGLLAAGPLEDLVRRWGTALVGRIEAEAAADERFRWALGGNWLQVGDVPPEVQGRIARASGGRIEPFVAHGAGRHRGPVT